MPHLVRFLMRHALIGVGLGALFVGTLVLLDVARLGTLMTQSSSGLIALIVLTGAVGITFGSVQMGFAIMLLGEDEQTPGKGRRARARTAQMIPALARAQPRSDVAEHRQSRVLRL
ncbi:hypothetical protein [Ancylobacter vacuolatus]|uniref:Membrane glycosyltransferase n=1 Tax=Ancylobacter vacuolatus TaxID=223389 RepID=A0ABU0DDU4_9HYPH|nr:hypothetical protein [Ancylobacter vacuolatus]MDQ0346596.1 membrane glycosyltransferase [Ancylobacter vacuolatus]